LPEYGGWARHFPIDVFQTGEHERTRAGGARTQQALVGINTLATSSAVGGAPANVMDGLSTTLTIACRPSAFFPRTPTARSTSRCPRCPDRTRIAAPMPAPSQNRDAARP
jgi:hypothetical protein